MVDNKVHLTTKISLFIANYGRELRIEADIKRKEKAIKFAERKKKYKRKQRQH